MTGWEIAEMADAVVLESTRSIRPSCRSSSSSLSPSRETLDGRPAERRGMGLLGVHGALKTPLAAAGLLMGDGLPPPSFCCPNDEDGNRMARVDGGGGSPCDEPHHLLRPAHRNSTRCFLQLLLLVVLRGRQLADGASSLRKLST